MKNIDYNILSNSLAIAHHRNKFIDGVEYLFANTYFNNIEKDGEIKSERELGLLTKKQKLDTPIKIDTTISFELYSILKNVDDVYYSYIFIDKEAFIVELELSYLQYLVRLKLLKNMSMVS